MSYVKCLSFNQGEPGVPGVVGLMGPVGQKVSGHFYSITQTQTCVTHVLRTTSKCWNVFVQNFLFLCFCREREKGKKIGLVLILERQNLCIRKITFAYYLLSNLNNFF